MDEPELEKPEIWFDLADGKLAAARDMQRLGHYRETTSAAYFAIFYAVKALLTTVGVEIHKHSGVGPKFSEYFVKTGKLEQRYARLIGEALRAREESDYQPRAVITQDRAAQLLAEAEEFVSRTKQLVKESQ